MFAKHLLSSKLLLLMNEKVFVREFVFICINSFFMQVKNKFILALLSAILLSLSWPERGLTPLVLLHGTIAAFGSV